MLFDFYLTHGSESYLIQAKKISFVETGENAEYSIWGARKQNLSFENNIFTGVNIGLYCIGILT